MESKKLILVLLLLPVHAWGRTWTVIHKGQTPDGAFVIVDAGSDDGIRPSSRICIKDAEGGDLACGPVTNIKANASGIRVTEADMKFVALGAIATFEGEKSEHQTADSWRRRISGRLISPLAQAMVYDAVQFNDAARSDAALPTWVKSETVTQGASGLSLSWDEPITQTYGVSLSLHVSQNHDIETRVQLQPLREGRWVTAITQGYNYGIHADLDWKLYTSGGFLLQAGTGLSVMQGAVSMSAEYRDKGVTTKIAKYSGKLWSLAAKADLEAHWATGNLGIFAGFHVIAPLIKLTDAYEGRTDFSAVDLGDASYTVATIRRTLNLRVVKGYAIEMGISFAL